MTAPALRGVERPLRAARYAWTEQPRASDMEITGTEMPAARWGPRTRITARRVWLSFSQGYPYAKTFTEVLANLQRAPLWNPSG